MKKINSPEVKFEVIHIDSLGQGVSKQDGKIYFIPKVLPGEKGLVKVNKTKKNVNFTSAPSLENFTELSSRRISSKCSHFQSCNGCHFLHTDYEHEVLLKKSSFIQEATKFLKNTPFSDVQAVPIKYHQASKRHNYRNRVQLHYDVKKRLLGYKISGNNILPVPGCMLAQDLVTEKIKHLYDKNHDQFWLNLVKKHGPRGHIEIYEPPHGKLEININKPYSFGLFTQVNQEMNLLLNQTLRELIPDEPQTFSFDLFGGDGNLSSLFNHPTLVVDSAAREVSKFKSHQSYEQLDLYSDDSLDLIKAIVKKHQINNVTNLILDPPRSGFKQLDQCISLLRPKNIFYISCDYHTLLRDIRELNEQYQIKQVHLFDMFPSTRHIEVMVHFSMN